MHVRYVVYIVTEAISWINKVIVESEKEQAGSTQDNLLKDA